MKESFQTLLNPKKNLPGEVASDVTHRVLLASSCGSDPAANLIAELKFTKISNLGAQNSDFDLA